MVKREVVGWYQGSFAVRPLVRRKGFAVGWLTWEFCI
jgi:hypothetical protein